MEKIISSIPYCFRQSNTTLFSLTPTYGGSFEKELRILIMNF